MADEIFFDGVRYIPAGDAAASAGISRDYVARLAREKKIIGRQIARQWYVSENSFKAFVAQNEYANAQRREDLAEQRKREYQRENAITPATAFSAAVTNAGISQAMLADRAMRALQSRVTQTAASALPMVQNATPAISHGVEMLHRISAAFVAVVLTVGVITSVDSLHAERLMAQRNSGSLSQSAAVSSATGNFFSMIGSEASAFFANVPLLSGLASNFTSGHVEAHITPIQNLAPNGNTNSTMATALVKATQPSKTSNIGTSKNATPASTPKTTTIVEQPIIQRVVEQAAPQQIAVAGGITEAELTEKLNELDNKLSSQIYSLTAANSTSIAQDYHVIAQTNRIDNLSNVTISNPTITGGSISGVALSASDLTGAVSTSHGGTGTTTAPGYGDVLIGNTAGGYNLVATSSLGISGVSSFTSLTDAPSTINPGDLFYGSPSNTLAALPIGNNGQVLKVQGGQLSWGADLLGSGGAGAWATSSDSLAVYPANTSNVILVGTDATSTTGNIFEAAGNALVRGVVTAYGGVRAPSITSTSTATSTFAGGIAVTSGCVSVNGTCLGSSSASTTLLSDANTWSGTQTFANASTTFGTISTLWLPNLASSFLKTDANGKVVAATAGTDYVTPSTLTNYLTLSNWYATTTDALKEGSTNKYYTDARVQSYLASVDKGFFFSTTSADYYISQKNLSGFSTTSADYWKTQNNFFSTTSANYLLGTKGYDTFAYLFPNNATSTNISFTGGITGNLTGDVTGNVIGDVSGNAGTATKLATARTINDVSFDGTSDITITAASSTLLVNNNTFSGTNTFTNTITGSISGNAGTVTNGVYTNTFGGLFDTNFAGKSTSDLAEGSNQYFTNARATANFVSNLAGTTSVKSITTLPSLSLPYTQLTGTPTIPTDNTQLTNGAGYVTSSFSTTSANFWKTKNNFFSTTSATYFLGRNQGLAFSTTSANYLLGTKGYDTFAYPFQNNATSTFLTFNNGLATTYASTTQISSAGNAYFATSGGNVGISTNSPKAPLDVGGLILTNILATPIANISANSNSIAGVQMENTSTGNYAEFRFIIGDTSGHYFAFSQPGTGNSNMLLGIPRNQGDFIFNSGGTARKLAIGTLQSADVLFGTNNTERMRITGDGNVGIGTSTPGSKFAVQGNALVSGNLVTAGIIATGTVKFTALTGGALATNANGELYNFSTSTLKAASSSLLADNNTFTGTNTFTKTITGSVTGNAGTVTNGVYTNTFGGLFSSSLAATTSINSITNLPNLSLPYSQLTGTPIIPTNNNQLTNGAGYLASGDNVSELTNDVGYVTRSFSTTSANFWKTQNNFFSTTSANYLLGTKSYDIFAYLFPGNATSTKLTFNGGVIATNATTTNLSVSGKITGAGLSSCSDSASKLLYDAATGMFTCGADAGAGGGITALGVAGQYQTGSTQTLATSSSAFNGLSFGVDITSAGNTDTFAPSVSGTLNNAGLTHSSFTLNGTPISLGDTKTITAASSTLLVDSNTFSGNNTFTKTITGSISGNAGTVTNGVYTTTFNNLFDTNLAGKSTSNLAEGSNLYFTPTRATSNFISNLAATTSVKSITTLPSLSLPYTQLTGTPTIPTNNIQLTNGAGYDTFAYLFPGNATTTNISFTGGITGNLTGNVTGNVSGNAGTATKLATARTINGVSFDGTADITITAASSTLLANNNHFSGINTFLGGIALKADGIDLNSRSLYNGSINLASVSLNDGTGTGGSGQVLAANGDGTYVWTSTPSGLTAASSTILTDNNHFSGSNTFTKPIAVGSGTGTSTFNGNIGITGSIIPSANNTYSLGSPTFEWKDVYIGPGSLYVNGQEVVHTDSGNDVVVSADSGQNLKTVVSGAGSFIAQAMNTGNVNLETESGNINITSTSGNLNIGTTGTGQLNLGTVHMGTWQGAAIAAAYGGTGSTTLSGILKGNGTGVVQTAVAGTDYLAPGALNGYLSLANWYATTTDALKEGNTNKYYTDARVQSYLASVDKGFFFSTTSANYLLGTKGYDTFAYPFPSNATSTKLTFNGGINVASGQSYQYNGVNIITASTALYDYFFGGAGNLTTTGTHNVALGYQSLNANTTGAGNTAVGSLSLASNTTGGSNTGLGYLALNENTLGDGNTAVGYLSLFANSTGESNTAQGFESMYSNTTGQQNTAQGYLSLRTNTTGAFNTALGYASLYTNSTGGSNTAVGYESLHSNSTGGSNTALGYQAGYSVAGSSGAGTNTLVGYQSGYDVTSGTNNLILGNEQTTGGGISSGSNNILLGTGVRYGLAPTGSNQLNIGNLIFGTGLGSENTLSTGKIGIGTTAPWKTLSVNGDLSLTGALFDSIASAGTNGMVLQTTGTGTKWVATSSLGFSTASTTLLIDNNTWSGKQTFAKTNTANASTSLLSVGKKAYFGGTATTTIDSSGNIVLPSNATVSGNGTLVLQSTNSGVNASGFISGNNGIYGFGSGSSVSGASADVAFSRFTSGTIALGNGGVGDTSGTLVLGAEAIGVSSASNLLDVNGAASIGYTSTLAPTNGLLVNGTVGIGTTTPWKTLSVNGDMALTGALFDSTAKSGTSGMVLQTTGTGTKWVATSSLGISGGGASFAYPFPSNATSTMLAFNGGINVAAGQQYQYDGQSVVTAVPSYGDYFFGGAGNLTMTGSSNTASGLDAFDANTSGSYNVANGAYALNSNSTGGSNSATGYYALGKNTTGYANTANGAEAFFLNTTGSGNTISGFNTFYYNTSATSSVAVGAQAGEGSASYHNQGGTYIGYNSGYSAGTDSDYNTLLGFKSGFDITTGTNNLILGTEQTTGSGITTGSNNILIGKGVRSGLSKTSSNQLNIGNLIFGTGLGSENTLSTGKIGIGTSTPWKSLSVKGDLALTGALFDSTAKAGGNGYVLQSTGIGTKWVATSSLGISGGGSTASSTLLADNNTFSGSNTFSSTLTLKGGLLLNQGSGATDNLVYLGSNTAGAVNASMGFFAAGKGSAGAFDGPYFLARGNDFSGIANQRGNMYFSAGSPNTPGTSEGSIVFLTNNNTSLRIDNSGRVGINTNNPDAALTLDSGVSPNGYMSFDNNGSLVGLLGVSNQPSQIFTGDNSGDFGIRSQSNLFLGSGGDNIRMTLASSGNVGIGTTTPTYKLDVKGDTNIAAGSAYRINGVSVLTASTTLSNYFFGNAGNLTTTGSNNTANGYLALNANTTGSSNVANGAYALGDNTTGSDNTANGFQSLGNNTSGFANTAFGFDAVLANTTGSYNVGIGPVALQDNTTGSNNVVEGAWAARLNSSATNTVAIGYKAAQGMGSYSNQGGTYFGYQSGLNSGTGSNYNTLLGYQSGYDVTTGTNNIVLGTEQTTGGGITTGSNNILIGTGVRSGLVDTDSNQLNIGNLIFGTGLGSESALSSGNVGIGTTTPGQKLDVNGNISIEDGNDLELHTAGNSAAGGIAAYSAYSGSGGLQFGAGGEWGTQFRFLQNPSGSSKTGAEFSFDTDNYLSLFNTSAAETARISGTGNSFFTAGNVGIGTTTPFSALSIVGGINKQLELGTTAGTEKAYLNTDGSGNLYIEVNRRTVDGVYDDTNAAHSRIQVTGTDGSGFISFSTTNTNSTIAPEVMRIAGSGKVGIGTTTPWAMLSVNAPAGKAAFAVGSTTSTLFSIDQNGVTNVGNPSGTGDATFQIGNDSNAWSLGYDSTDKSFRIASSTGLTNNVALSIFKGGSVGIDTDVIVGALTVANGTDHTLNVRGDPVSFGLPSTLLGPILQGVNNAQTVSEPLTLDGSTINLIGNVGIGTTSPSNFKLQVAGNVGPDKSDTYNLGSSGNNWGCLYYNGGTLGTCASDFNLKTNIQPLSFDSTSSTSTALDQLASLQLHSFAYKAATSTIYHGLIAQEVQKVAPELVATATTSTSTYLEVRYGDVQWLTVQAVQELKKTVDGVTGITSDFKNALIAWFGNAGNGIGNLFANQVNTNKLCVKASDGTDVCVTGDQLKKIVAGQTASAATTQGTGSSPSGSSGAPQLSVNGNDPATVETGMTYTDLGAKITGPAGDLNLGIKATIDGGATTTLDKVSIDTTIAGTHTILYFATDQNGLTGYATRTVVVGDATTTATSTSTETQEKAGENGNDGASSSTATSTIGGAQSTSTPESAGAGTGSEGSNSSTESTSTTPNVSTTPSNGEVGTTTVAQ